jgi:signal transduction histidine kinase
MTIPEAEFLRRQLEARAAIERELLAELDLGRLLELVVDHAARLAGAEGAIYLLGGDRLTLAARTGTEVLESPIAVGAGVTGECARTGEGSIVNDYAASPAALPDSVARGVRRVMAEPLRLADGLLGVITLSRRGDDARPFGPDDHGMLGPFARQAALALRNATLYEDAQRRRRAAEGLADLARSVASLDTEQVLRTIVARGRDVLGAPVAVALVAQRLWRFAPIDGIPDTFLRFEPSHPRDGVTATAIAERRPVWSADILGDPAFQLSEPTRRFIESTGRRAALAVPVLAGERVLGALITGREEVGPFTAEEIHLLETAAACAAVALENARLYAEAEGRGRRLATLVEVGQRLTRDLDLAAVTASIVEAAAAVFEGEAGCRLVEGETLVRAATTAAARAVMEPYRLQMGESIAGHVALTGVPLVTPDRFRSPLIPARYRGAADKDRTGASMCVPVRIGGRVLGTLSVFRERGHRFDEGDLALGTSLANQAAIAISNARSFEEAERRRREAEIVARIARTVSGSLDLDAILQKVVAGARLLCGSDMARIALRDPRSGAMVFRYWVNVRYPHYDQVRVQSGQGVGGQVVRTGKSFRTDDWRRDPRISKETLRVVEAEGIVAMLAVPIRIGEEVEGLLYVDNRVRRPFTDHDETVLTQLADHAGLAIHDARRFVDAQQARERLQALSAQLLNVQETERRRIARELHDEVGQALTAVRINLQLLEPGVPPAAGRVEETLEILDRALQDVRRLALDLRPSLLDDLGLVPALQWFVRARTEGAGLVGAVVAELGGVLVPPDLATTCFRVVQEAVTNVIRHAAATHVWVELRHRDSRLEVTIRDDGRGFDVATAHRLARGGRSLGLLSLAERVELAGGRSTIESAPAAGTTVRAWFPLKPT